MEVQENIPVAPIVKVPIPNSQGILILGIFSLVTSFCCLGIGFISLILGIIAITMSPKAMELYEQNPKVYSESSLKNVTTGRICGIIGICLNGLLILGLIVTMLILGTGLAAIFSTIPWDGLVN